MLLLLFCCCCPLPLLGCCGSTPPPLFTFPPFVVTPPGAAVVPGRAAIEEKVSGDFVEALDAADVDAITVDEEGAELEDDVPTTESDIELPWP